MDWFEFYRLNKPKLKIFGILVLVFIFVYIIWPLIKLPQNNLWIGLAYVFAWPLILINLGLSALPQNVATIIKTHILFVGTFFMIQMLYLYTIACGIFAGYNILKKELDKKEK